MMLGRRYPIGTSHKDLGVMEQAVRDCFDELDALYGHEGSELHVYLALRRALQGFLVVNGLQRMRNFDDYEFGREIKELVASGARETCQRNCGLHGPLPTAVECNKANDDSMIPVKSIFFYPSDVKYTLPLYLQHSSPSTDMTTLYLANPERLPSRRIGSYIKYLLRGSVSEAGQ